LNVGALPADQKDAIVAFLPEATGLLELAIDPERKPDLIGNFCDAAFGLDRAFDTVLLCALATWLDPYRAVRNAFSVLRPSGRFLLACTANTHPERGGLWRPHDRPTWRIGDRAEAREVMGGPDRLWSFDRLSMEALFAGWSGEIKLEFFFHHWFVVATKTA
jgi:SAM-dependent methyltransferase